MTDSVRYSGCADSVAALRYSLQNELLAVLVAAGLTLLGPPGGAQAATVCEAADYGVRSGADDNLNALRRALQACGGKTLHIAAGTYELSPKGFDVGLTVPGGTVVIGDGRDGPRQTILRVETGGNLHSVLWIRNVSHVAVHGIRFEGSTYESGCARHLDYGHAIYIHSDAGQSARVADIDISANTFYNFNGQNWIAVNAQDGSPGVANVRINGNSFESDRRLQGSCAGTDITHATDMVALHGSDQSANGQVSDVSVASNTFNAAYVNTAVAAWSGTTRIRVENNTVRDAGRGLPQAAGSELGSYAVLIYNSAHELPGLHPDVVAVTGNEITNPVSCGVYVAGAADLTISGNRISGQSDRFDDTLPKAAIALNHALRVRVLSDNELRNNYLGISSVASELNLGNNRIDPAAGGRASKIIRGTPGWSQQRPPN
jgi:hypothetical protein